MAIITAGSKFLGLKSTVDTTERNSDRVNANTHYWTIEDLNQTITAADATGTANTLAHYNGSGALNEAGEVTVDSSGNITSTANVTTATINLGALNTAPASASATGTVGQIRIDASHIYVCVASNTWKRVAIAAF
jgi:hypothetical protein